MAAQDQFEIPQDMRVFAEKSVAQARQAFDGFMSAAHQAVNRSVPKIREYAATRTMTPATRTNDSAAAAG